jgi:iron(II)-dependent oxidoreductase
MNPKRASRLTSSLTRFVIIILLFLQGGADGQERGALLVEEIEQLLGARVTPRRMTTLIEEYGVDFEVTEEVRERLRRAGADDVVMGAVEKSGLGFARKRMVLIPAGEFWMGCNERVDRDCYGEEKPGRRVYLDAFYINKYEVTVAEYSQCVRAGRCSSEGLTGYSSCNWGQGEREDHPINCVDWDQAKAYCKWTDKRLPTEAEWEKAARGEDGRKYPWGNQWDSSRVNTNEGRIGRTVSVGSYSSGVSPYGVHDMAGNVWEWVQDWYDDDYYGQSPSRNPRGPSNGSYRVLRGGSWNGSPGSARSSDRSRLEPDARYDGRGFRCAQ